MIGAASSRRKKNDPRTRLISRLPCDGGGCNYEVRKKASHEMVAPIYTSACGGSCLGRPKGEGERMKENYRTAANRIFYVCLRKQTKCPPIIAVKTNWEWYVEAKDGSIMLESVSATDSWDAKAAGVQAWNAKFVDKVEETNETPQTQNDN